MSSRAWRLFAVLLVTAHGRSVAFAAPHVVLGKSFVVKDPAPGLDPSQRTVVGVGKKLASPDVVVGDPIANGATIELIANGGTSTRQTIVIPGGAAVAGLAGWKSIGWPIQGYSYRDRAGVNGPVKSALIKKTSGGTFVVKATLRGSLGPGPQPHVTVVPPAPGTAGGMRFTLGGGDTYCVAFGGAAGGAVTNSPDPTGTKVFKVTSRSTSPTVEAGCPVASAYTLTVGNGYGSGQYAPGTTVHVWAAARPQDQVVTGWTGNAGLLAEPEEWHTTLVMPAADVSIAATIVDRPTTLSVGTYLGTTSRPKTVRSAIPPGARGLVLFLHGTSGNNTFITKPETFAVALRALEAGYAVLGTEAEEAVAGDLNGDGKERWDASLTTANVDLGNLNARIASLRGAGTIGPTTPLYALGMSNGGSMAISLGAVASVSSVAGAFPELVFDAVVSHCADGRAGAAAVTNTPTAWLMCTNDDNDEVSNTDAAAYSAALAGRGIPTLFDLHPASPLYDERFLRVSGLTLATSHAIAAETRAAGFVDGTGFFVVPTDTIITTVLGNPGLMPTLTGLPGSVQLDVLDQVKAMQAEHQMYSDWARRAVAFFEAHGP